MLKQILKLSVILSLVLVVSASGVRASGKMEVALGEKVTLQAEDVVAGSFKWVAKKGKNILSTQETSIFNYTFDQQGEYSVNLAITDAAGNTKNTTVLVLVGNRYSVQPGASGAPGEGSLINVPLEVNYETLPMQTAERTVHIVGNEGRVVFDIGARDDILEYRIDRNIYLDSDGNGIANDDIDNADHSSYLRGGTWQTKYLATESNKIAAEVTVVNKAGQKAKSQVEIVFDSIPSKEGNVVAVLDTLPALDSVKKKIFVYDALDTVAFYSRRSQGDIVEYRIDKNIFVDSDGDGNPANDIDNRADNSFKSGDVWTVTYEKTDQQIIAQLIVVGRSGAGSRIQREIAFTDRPSIPVSEVAETTETESGIRLTADKEFVQKGDPIVFKVEGLTQSMDAYTFDWDFNGDGTVDQTVEGENTVSYIFDSPGIQPVKVRVRDTDGNEASFQLDTLVQDTVATAADFDFSLEGKTVTFTNLSTANAALANKTLKYTWSFGDTDPQNYEAQKDRIGTQNPIYTFTKPGTYVVTLTVVDADSVTSTKSTEVVIAGAAEDVQGGQPAEEAEAVSSDGGGSFLWAMFKVIFYIILGIVLLVVLIVLGLLIFLKVQHPDLVFEELIDELKIKILGILGIQEVTESSETPKITSQTSTAASFETSARAKPAPQKPSKPSAETTPTEVKEASMAKTEVEPGEVVQPPEAPRESAPVPDWLKKTTPAGLDTSTPPVSGKPEVIEGEVEEVRRTPDSSGEQPKTGQEKDKGPVPDWLKNA